MKTIRINLYTSIAILFAMLFSVTNSFAQVPGGGTSGTGGPGGPGCSIPSFTTGTYSTQLTSNITNACAPSTITLNAYASLQFTNMPIHGGVFRHVLTLYKQISVGGGYTPVGTINCSQVVLNSNTSGAISTGNTITTFVVNTSGTYYITAVLQYSCNNGGTWYNVGATQGSNTTTVTINQSNNNANFNLGGATHANLTSPAPTVYNCPTNMILNAINTGNVASYSIKLEIGKWTFNGTSWVFTLAPINTTTTPINTLQGALQTVLPANISLPIPAIDLYSWNGGFFKPLILGYAGDLRVTYQINSATVGTCISGSKTMVQVFNLPDVAFYKAYKSNTLCTPANNEKDLVTVLPISTLMPTTKQLLCPLEGWQGPNSAGISSIDIVASDSWELLVYEVNSGSGINRFDRKFSAPNVYRATGTGDFSQNTRFNDLSQDFVSTLPPFYCVSGTSTSPAQFNNEYFYDFYAFAKLNNTLNDFSSRTWCTDLTVNKAGCKVQKLGYFRVVGTANSQTWKKENEDLIIDELTEDIFVYPNPTNGIINIEFGELSNNSSLIVYDFNGKIIMNIQNIKSLKRQIDLSKFSNGLYHCILNTGLKTKSFNIIKN
jgi:Secretion system C-terminal sorting domain